MFCSKCGSKLNDDDLFCSKCGAKINIIKDDDEVKSSDEEKITKEEKEAAESKGTKDLPKENSNRVSTQTANNVEEKKDVVIKREVNILDENAVKIKYPSSEAFLRAKLAERSETKKAYYSIEPNISEKVLVNAASKIANGISPSKILAVYDTTLFGSGKEGIVYTGNAIYIKPPFSSNLTISLENMKDADYITETIKCADDTEKTKKYVVIKYDNDQEDVVITNTDYSNDELEYLGILLKQFCVCVDKVEDKNYRYSSLTELGDGIIGAYISIVCAYLKSDDGIIDAKEYKELISLMAKIRVSKELSDKLRDVRLNIEKNNYQFKDLIANLNNELNKESLDTRAIYQSLFKDLLTVKCDNLKNWKSDKSLVELKNLLQITDDQLDVLIKSIENDKKIVEERLEDHQVKEMAKEMAAVAGGAGVTLAALAVTGGVSSGIWGGLITLGTMSTGGMLLGLAAIGGLGYGAYKGIKYFSGTSELEKSGIRIAALQSSIENNKLAITYIIEDVNWLNYKISELFDKVKESNALNDELTLEITKYLGFAESVGESGMLIEEHNQKDNYEINLAKLPTDLPYDKFMELVSLSPDKETIVEFILSVYVKQEIECKTDEDDEESETYTKTVYRREDELSYETAQKAYNYFNLIGLYDTKSSAVAQGKAIAKKGLNSIKSILGV